MLEEAEEQFADMLKYGMLPSESCATMVIRLRVQVNNPPHTLASRLVMC